MTPGDLDPLAGLEDIEIMARTLTAEHEAAEQTRTDGPVAFKGESDETLPPVLPAGYADRGEIGRGGMGAVRAAFDEELKRPVAIKVMLPSLNRNGSVAQRFIDEARITASIDHPNIAPVYRLARSNDGSLSLVMKLIEGRTLRSYLNTLPPPPWPASLLDAVLSIFGKICDAVAFAHSRGVIHLDLKPDNIMLGPFGQAYVVDWGIARKRPAGESGVAFRTASSRGASMGTPSYMSPEQALRAENDITPLTDVFLLGGMLYEILTGQRPHEGATVVAVVGSAIRGRITPPADRAPHRFIPPALAAIAMRALAPLPADRYPSVLDLQGEVLAFQRGEERAPRRTYEAGAVVLREGDRGNEAFVVISGRCAVTTMSEGRRLVLRELGAGDVFGETAIFSDEPRSATVEATETLVVRVVTGETLTQTLGLQTWTGEFVKALAERFREADRLNRKHQS